MFNVLFICTGNSARSIMAEAILNAPSRRERFKGYSAGSHPKGTVHPLALQTLAENHLAADGLRSKSWDEFAGPNAPHFDFIFTVCDQAAAEVCPIWPGHPVTAHWGVRDPAAVEGSAADQRRTFSDAFRILRRRIDLFKALPIDKLSALALQERVTAIGRETGGPADTRQPEPLRDARPPRQG